jgi:hypothetical protein
MDNETTIRSLKKQLLIERIVFGSLLLLLVINFAVGKLGGGKSMIVVDGKPVIAGVIQIRCAQSRAVS